MRASPDGLAGIASFTVLAILGLSALHAGGAARAGESLPAWQPLPREKLKARGAPRHPTVYLAPEDLVRARRNVERWPWASEVKESIVKQADKWLERDAEFWLSRLPGPGACYAYGFTGCPICGARWGTWRGARCTWDDPGHVTCYKGHRLPDKEHPDDGKGYKAPDGRLHYFVGSYNAWVTEQFTLDALPNLSRAYALTGDERYAEMAAAIFDGLASIYSESTSGSWDYPSNPPSGRFARPWYQVSRVLVHYVAAYDLLHGSASLDKPSLRKGHTRRSNIEEHLLQDGAYYCYKHSFAGVLHNGHADYMRGAMAVGILLGIPEYVEMATSGPYSIDTMLSNNVDRDGRYYETSFGYAAHTRSLYHTFAEPLRNCRVEPLPQGLNLFADRRFVSFLTLPEGVINVCGRSPNLGDHGPDVRWMPLPPDPFGWIDRRHLEQLLAGSPDPESKRKLTGMLLCTGGEEDRAGSRMRDWLLFRAEPLEQCARQLPDWLEQRCYGSWVMGQKGVAILRSETVDKEQQGVVLRYGPTLNHGDYDELHLAYYARGYELTYDIGYGLGSTHVHCGFASQTISHCTVTVDETSQMQGDGSGGSLHLFAAMPGFQLLEASSENAYSFLGVDMYRRTVAMIGGGGDAFLIDVFRVRGGKQHDFALNSLTTDAHVLGFDRKSTQHEGSLAGRDIDWGRKIGNDGDIKGYPNKPYWRPPPPNGYGFFYDIKRGVAAGPLTHTWHIPGKPGARYRTTLCPQPGDETIMCDAPGLYPSRPESRYLIQRRVGEEGLESCFVALHQSAGEPIDKGLHTCAQLKEMAADASAETKIVDSYAVFLLKASKAGENVEFKLGAENDCTAMVEIGFIQAPSYGKVQAFLDGQPLGKPIDLKSDNTGAKVAIAGKWQDIKRGEHTVRIETMKTPDERDTHYVGIRSIRLTVENAPEPAPAYPVSSVSPVTVQCERTTALKPVALLVRTKGGDMLFVSGSDENGMQSCRSPEGEEVRWRGCVALIGLAGARMPVRTCEINYLEAPGVRFEGQGAVAGKVIDCDYEKNEVRIDAALPEGVNLAGHVCLFNSDRYTRNSAYTVRAVRREGDATVLEFRDQSLVLGKGRVFAREGEGVILSDIRHEYALSVTRKNTMFFDGKTIGTTDGRTAIIRKLAGSTPMKIEIEGRHSLELGDTFLYYDVVPGDSVRIPICRTMER